MNNQETNTHQYDEEADQKGSSSTEVPLLSEVELDEQVCVPNRSSLNVNQVGGFTMPRASIPHSEITSTLVQRD